MNRKLPPNVVGEGDYLIFCLDSRLNLHPDTEVKNLPNERLEQIQDRRSKSDDLKKKRINILTNQIPYRADIDWIHLSC